MSVDRPLNPSAAIVTNQYPLPPEVFGQVFSFLGLEDITSLQRVSRLFKRVVDDDPTSFFTWCSEGCRRVIERNYRQASTEVDQLLAYRQELENNLAAEQDATERALFNEQIEAVTDEITKIASGFSQHELDNLRRARYKKGSLKLSAHFMRALNQATRDLNLESCIRLKWQYKITKLFEDSNYIRPKGRLNVTSPLVPDFYTAILSDTPDDMDMLVVWKRVSRVVEYILGAVGSVSVKFKQAVNAFCSDLSTDHRAIRIRRGLGGIGCENVFTGALRETSQEGLNPSQEWSQEGSSFRRFHLVKEGAVLSGQFSADEQFNIHLMLNSGNSLKLDNSQNAISNQEYSEQLNLLYPGRSVIPLPSGQINRDPRRRVQDADPQTTIPMLPGWLIAPHAADRHETERHRLFHHSLHMRSLLGMSPNPMLFRRAIELADLSLIYLLIAAHRIVSKRFPSKEDSAFKTGAELHHLSWILLEALRLGKLDIVQSLLLADCPLGSFKNAGLLDLALAPHNRSDLTALNNIVRLLLNRGASCTQRTLSHITPELLDIFDPETQAQLQTLWARPFSQQALLAICRSESLELLEWAVSQLPPDSLQTETLHGALDIFQKAAEGDRLLRQLLASSPDFLVKKETLIRCITGFCSAKIMTILVSKNFEMPEESYWKEIIQTPTLFQPAVLVLLNAFKKNRAQNGGPANFRIVSLEDQLTILKAKQWLLMDQFRQTEIKKSILKCLCDNNGSNYDLDFMGELQSLVINSKCKVAKFYLKRAFANGAPVNLEHVKGLDQLSLYSELSHNARWVNDWSLVLNVLFACQSYPLIDLLLTNKSDQFTQDHLHEIIYHLRKIFINKDLLNNTNVVNIVSFVLNKITEGSIIAEERALLIDFFKNLAEHGPDHMSRKINLADSFLKRDDIDLTEIKTSVFALLNKSIASSCRGNYAHHFFNQHLIQTLGRLDADELARNYLFKDFKIIDFLNPNVLFPYFFEQTSSFVKDYLKILHNKGVRLNLSNWQRLAQDVGQISGEIKEIGQTVLQQLPVLSNIAPVLPEAAPAQIAMPCDPVSGILDRKRTAVEDPDGAPDRKRQHAIPPQPLVVPPMPHMQNAPVWFHPMPQPPQFPIGTLPGFALPPQLPMMPPPGFALPPQQTFNPAPQVAPARVLPENEGPSEIRPLLFDTGFNPLDFDTGFNPLDYEDFNPDLHFFNHSDED